VSRLCGVLIVVTACGRVGFDPTAANGDDDAQNGGDGGDPLSDAVFVHNVAFLTKRTYAPSTLAGTAADAICNQEASEDGLPGTYVAWLSTTTTNAISRLTGSRGWVRADGMPFVDTLADLAASRILTPLEVMSNRARDLSTLTIITATDPDGTFAGQSCGDFTSTSGFGDGGIPQAIGAQWTSDIASPPCNAMTKLYCFGVGHTLPVSIVPVTGRKAFISTNWAPGAGLASADARCQTDAMTAGFTGTFRAMLATSTASGASRFIDGLPWVRQDGIPIAPTAAALLANDMHVPPLDNNAQPPDNFDHAWLGAQTLVDIGTEHCNDWASSAAGQTAFERAMAISASDWGRTPCNATYKLFCLEI